jgi:hypothetical protein
MIVSNIIKVLLLINVIQSFPIQEKEVDFRDFGKGTIHLNDNRTLVKIQLIKIEQSWITYEKNRTLHDLAFENINYLVFPNSKEGNLEIRFEEGNKIIKTIRQ